MGESGDGWDQYSKLVLSELQRHDANHEKTIARIEHLNTSMNNRFNKLEIEINTLKVKSGIWGMIAGMIPGAIYLLIDKLK